MSGLGVLLICVGGEAVGDKIRLRDGGGGRESLVFGGVLIPAVALGLGGGQGLAGIGNVAVSGLVDDPCTCIGIRPDGVGLGEGGDGADFVGHGGYGWWVVGTLPFYSVGGVVVESSQVAPTVFHIRITSTALSKPSEVSGRCMRVMLSMYASNSSLDSPSFR
jgi:hypothetical protein